MRNLQSIIQRLTERLSIEIEQRHDLRVLFGSFDELKDQSKHGYVSPFDFALIYMGLGEKDQAFEWLNKTLEENPYRLSFIKVNPRFDSLRSDGRFTDLLRRMKLAS